MEARTDAEGVSQTESLARLRNSKQSTFFCPFCLVLHCRSFRTLSKVSLFLFFLPFCGTSRESEKKKKEERAIKEVS